VIAALRLRGWSGTPRPCSPTCPVRTMRTQRASGRGGSPTVPGEAPSPEAAR
jgi:hypothetical protein